MTTDWIEVRVARKAREAEGIFGFDLVSAHGDRLPPGVNSDLHRAMAFVGRVWRHLVEMIAQAQKQALNKS